MRNFDYSFLRSGLLPARLVDLVAHIEAMKTMAVVHKKEHGRLFKELEAFAKVCSVKSSNAIEGIVTADERIAAIVDCHSAPLDRDEAEIAGYRDTLNEIFLHHDRLDLSVRDILRLHELMLALVPSGCGGSYKTSDNLIIEEDEKGERRVRFRPVSAAETPKAMEQLELAYLTARDDAHINKLLLIPCVILDLLCIHPFSDGNGRISRLLSLLLLLKNGYDAGKYVSFEEKIDKYKGYYYESLRRSSLGWEDGQNSYFPFLENFLSMLYLCYKDLDKRFSALGGKRLTKAAGIEAAVINSPTPLSKKDLCALLPDVSPTTVEAVLGALVKKGKIKRLGASRASRYIGS